ncbi:hypothetical protein D9599_01045 [Roseomonas sp. KE2513]|nr:hypothetical protein [Roseomonas sp. KE2513]
MASTIHLGRLGGGTRPRFGTRHSLHGARLPQPIRQHGTANLALVSQTFGFETETRFEQPTSYVRRHGAARQQHHRSILKNRTNDLPLWCIVGGANSTSD